MRQRVNYSAVVAVCLAVLLTITPNASALRCYQCTSSDSWSHCQSNAIEQTCTFSTQVSILGQDVFVPAQARQLELACLSVSAEASIGGAKGYAFVRQCFYNDQSMCSLIQGELPAGFTVTACDLCTTDLCNGANSVTIAFSSVLLMAVAVMLRK